MTIPEVRRPANATVSAPLRPPVDTDGVVPARTFRSLPWATRIGSPLDLRYGSKPYLHPMTTDQLAAPTTRPVTAEQPVPTSGGGCGSSCGCSAATAGKDRRSIAGGRIADADTAATGPKAKRFRRKRSKETGGMLAMAGIACVACCIGPIMAFLGGVTILGAASTTVIGVAGLVIAAMAMAAAAVVLRRRRTSSCAMPETTPVDLTARR